MIDRVPATTVSKYRSINIFSFVASSHNTSAAFRKEMLRQSRPRINGICIAWRVKHKVKDRLKDTYATAISYIRSAIKKPLSTARRHVDLNPTNRINAIHLGLRI